MQREQGIAIIAAAKNRSEPLRYSLATWIDTPARQIILVDWCSDTPLIETLDSMDVYDYPDPRIIHVRVENEPYWNPCAAWNLAAQFVTQDKILKLDADVCVSQRWMLENLEHNQLRTLDWDGARSQNEAFLTGSWYGFTSNFIAAGGYDERLEKSYGYEDDDLYKRMVKAGAIRQQFEKGALLHLPHSQKTRFENYEIPDTNTDASELLHHTNPDWNHQQAVEEGSLFKPEKIRHNQYRATRIRRPASVSCFG